MKKRIWKQMVSLAVVSSMAASCLMGCNNKTLENDAQSNVSSDEGTQADIEPIAAVQKETAVTGLSVNYESGTANVSVDEKIRFNWKLSSNVAGLMQSSYQIVVKDEGENEVWNSGVVNGTQSTAVSYEGDALEKEHIYQWTVTVKDNTGAETTSEKHTFITDTDTSVADWIIPVQSGTVSAEEQTKGTSLVRTGQKLENKEIDSAILYMSALGVYTPYINGQKVSASESENIFAPGWTDYNSYVNYQSYDVTSLLNGTDIVLGAEIGTGWYSGMIGTNFGFATGFQRVLTYLPAMNDDKEAELALWGKLVVNYKDGTKQIIATDDTWQSTDQTAVTSADFFYGEDYDAGIAAKIKEWNTVGYDTAEWEGVTVGTYNGKMYASSAAMTSIQTDKERIAKSGYTYETNAKAKDSEQADLGEVEKTDVDVSGEIELKADQTLIVDFGQNGSGAARLTAQGKAGTVISVLHAERLSDGVSKEEEGYGATTPAGTLYTDNLSDCDPTDNYTLSGDVDELRAVYTYHGFQYVAITATDDVKISSITADTYTAVGAQTGTVVTNDEQVNQLFSNNLWSHLSNYVSIPTDCDQRGERAGWSGDAQVYGMTALYNYDIYSLLENYNEIMQQYEKEKGFYSDIMPDAFMTIWNDFASSGWSDAGIIIPYILYRQTGDDTMIRKYYKQMSDYMEYVAKNGYSAGTTDEDGNFSDGVFGDWLAYDAASLPYLNAVYEIYTNQLMSEMSALIGKDKKASSYSNKAEKLKTAAIKKYVDADGNIMCSTIDYGKNHFESSSYVTNVTDNAQTALLWALKLELYETEEQHQGILQNLLDNIANKDGSWREGEPENTLSVGFLGINVLLPVLSEEGASKTAYDLLLQNENPSWLFEVEHGATTIWERWDSYSDIGYGSSGMNSFNHYSYGSCAEWMYRYMGGIDAGENAGFSSFILQPALDLKGRINEADVAFESVMGKIGSAWTSENGTLKSYSCTVPANTTAELYLPVDAENGTVKTTGVEYIGKQTRNNVECQVYKVASGGYTFTVDNGVVNVVLNENYSE